MTAARQGLAPGLLLAAALCARPARADSPHARDVQLTMLGSGLFDAGYVAASAAAMATGFLVLNARLADVAPLDGLGHRSRNLLLDGASDIAVTAGLSVGLGLGLAGERGAGRRGADLFRAPLVLAEGALVASAFALFSKNFAGACRPRDWRDQEQRCSTDGELGGTPLSSTYEAHRSFPSGHTAPLGGMAGAALGLWLLPTGTRREFGPLAAVSGAFALSIAALRPAAGAHSWVDTGTALVVGYGLGFLTALLHTRRAGAGETATLGGPSAAPLSLGGSFLA